MFGKFRGVIVGLGLVSSSCGGDGGGTEGGGSSTTAVVTTDLTVDPTTTGATTDEPTSSGTLTSGVSESATGTDTALTTTTDDSTTTGTTDQPVTATDTSTSEPGTTTLEPDTTTTDTTTGRDPGDPLWVNPNLWYSVEDKLHYIEIDEDDGSVVQLVTSTISTPLLDGFDGLTMLEDGSLLGSRVLTGMGTQIFHIPEPPVEPSTIEVEVIGMVPDTLLIEALYTDCKGLVYLMDSGVDLASSDGNRLIRFTGEYLDGDLNYEVITDLEDASVADIDDLGPGINLMGEITDGTGFAIDSGEVYLFDYNNGTGAKIGDGGTWGSHALGGPLFTDNTARLYLLDIDAKLVEADPTTLALSPVLVTGPKPAGDAPAGWSGLTGPLTECESTLPQ
jgi:hypothetical protein